MEVTMNVRQSNRTGFTLVEILTVVVILGIASAIVVPQIGSRDDLKVRSAARMVMADLIYAQNRAVATQSMLYVQFDQTNQCYTLLSSISPAVAIKHPITKNDYVVRFASGGAGGKVDSSLNSFSFDSQTTLAFDELGMPYSYDPTKPVDQRLSPLNSGSLVLKNKAQTKTITVVAYTGEVTVQ